MSATAEVPAMDCLLPGHLWVGMAAGKVGVGCWCIWCGTAAYNEDLLDQVTEVVAYGDWKGR
jgi:hypothetical protein